MAMSHSSLFITCDRPKFKCKHEMETDFHPNADVLLNWHLSTELDKMHGRENNLLLVQWLKIPVLWPSWEIKDILISWGNSSYKKPWGENYIISTVKTTNVKYPYGLRKHNLPFLNDIFHFIQVSKIFQHVISMSIFINEIFMLFFYF